MAKDFSTYQPGLDSPAGGAEAIVNGTTLATPSRGIYVGGAGHLGCVMANGTTAFYENLVAGQVYPFRITLATTTTTATKLWSLND